MFVRFASAPQARGTEVLQHHSPITDTRVEIHNVEEICRAAPGGEFSWVASLEKGASGG